jgi:hypothetical protein
VAPLAWLAWAPLASLAVVSPSGFFVSITVLHTEVVTLHFHELTS